MSWLTGLFCCLLLFAISPEASSSIRLKKTWDTFEVALSLYFGVDAGKTIREYFKNEDATFTQGELTTISKLNQLSQDVQAARDAILSKISEQLSTKLSENIHSLFKLAADVEFVYKRYLGILKTIRRRTLNELIDFTNTITKHEHNLINGFERMLFKMHEVLVSGNEKLESTLSIINRESSHIDVICSKKESSQQLINDLYNLVVDSHMKGLQVRKFAFAFRQEYERQNYQQSMDDDFESFKEAVTNSYNAVKSAMKIAPRTLYRCNPDHWLQGKNYAQLGPALQTHIVVSSDLTGDGGNCQTKKAKHSYYSDFSLRLEVSKRCEQGYIRDCQPLGPSFEVCYSDKSSPRMYDWAKTSDNDIYGFKNVTNCSNKTMEESLGFFRSKIQNHCLCTCDSGRRAEDRYFSLTPVVSDDSANKVVTGMKLVKKGRVFYIVIQEGTMGPGGTILYEPVWKEVPKELLKNQWYAIAEVVTSTSKHKIPYTDIEKDDVRKFVYSTYFHRNEYLYPVTYDSRKVHLDDLSAEQNEVITGLQFIQTKDNALALSIRVTPYNYKTGQLNVGLTHWKTSDFKGVRQEILLTEPDVPSASNPKGELQISGHGKYLSFTSTDNRKDLGQNTVPFIDTQAIVTNPPMPITGAGLIHKGTSYSGGFLAFKLKHYDLV